MPGDAPESAGWFTHSTSQEPRGSKFHQHTLTKHIFRCRICLAGRTKAQSLNVWHIINDTPRSANHIYLLCKLWLATLFFVFLHQTEGKRSLRQISGKLQKAGGSIVAGGRWMGCADCGQANNPKSLESSSKMD